MAKLPDCSVRIIFDEVLLYEAWYREKLQGAEMIGKSLQPVGLLDPEDKIVRREGMIGTFVCSRALRRC